MNSILLDVRYAVRGLRKAPGLALLAILCMGLGLASVTVMFSTADTFSFRPLPQVRDAGRVMHVWEAPADAPAREAGMAPAAYRDARALPEFSDLTAQRGWSANISGIDVPERVGAALVSANFLRAIGRAPALGRDFTPADDESGAGHVVILTHGLWQRRFGGDSDLVGRAVRINGEPYTVVGVLPQDFVFPPGAELLAPLAFTPDDWAMRRGQGVFVLGRLARGVTPSRAAAAVAQLGARLSADFPATNAKRVMLAEPAEPYFGQGPRPFMMVLLAAGAFVLLIACANVANLLLARATGRRRELAVRLAMGAPRARLVREQLAESVLISVAGGVLGMFGTLAGLHAMATSVPVEVQRFIPGFGELRLDGRALGVAALATFGAGLLSGVVPALGIFRVDIQRVLREGGRGEAGDARSGRVRSALVVLEVALSLLLLVGATQTMDTFRRLALTNPGFRSGDVLTLSVTLPARDYPQDSAVDHFYQTLQDRIGALPGVLAVGSTTILPLSWYESSASVDVEGHPLVRREDAPVVGWRRVSPGYLETLAIPLVTGRTMATTDRMSTAPVAVVSERAARLLWPGEDALGKRFRADSGQWIEVVGVVRDVRGNPLMGRDVGAAVYVSNRQWPARILSFVVRSAGDPAALARPIQQAINAIDSRLAAGDVAPMPRVVAAALSPQSATARTLVVTALVALLMACVGTYGVMTYNVSQRTQEIGVRIALGATPGGVLRLVLGGTAKLAGIGIAIGLALVVAMSRGLQAILVGTTATDPLALSAVALALVTVTAASSWIPARRATRVDPMEALRAE
ncbi:MAG TPA: ABC transporter permease [Gemmatimonadales bacterium]|nr:ABC transporter permease [Gemmatimonadales bacterium]